MDKSRAGGRGHRGTTGIILAAVLSAVLGCAIGQASSASAAEVPLVTAVDLRSCATALLAGYEVTRLAPVWGLGLEAAAVEGKTKEFVGLGIGVFGSREEAASAAVRLANDSSIRLQRGSPGGEALGDSSWWAEGSIILCRDNVVVRIVGLSRNRVEDLAKTVDRDLIQGATWLERGPQVARPSLAAGTPPLGPVAVGQEAEIRVDATAADRHPLYFAYNLKGGELLGGDPPAPFQFRAESKGNHLLRFAAVSDRCVVSPVLEIPVTVVEGH